ncbi:putative transcription initiation factor IIB [Rhizoctonia solani 123E]|uniref:Putative transcription initiation factor IIB n=1 Tax=Rhizoctonia solani 123E TaxID=1423351 RepID=A0A074SA60_9AGAM|nr:putative transcription initiation factor IIB [Rhizoctonia solani 123E]
MSCPACGSHALHFDDEVLCLLCTSCGNVVESNQSALDFSMITEKGTGTNFGMGRTLHNQSSTLVARSGRYLSGDTKEARWMKNLEATKSFLAAVARNMRQSPCTERAQYIMEQAMRKGKFRWGQGAERIAGASICIALRESGRAESTREVAVHIQCRQDYLARTYRRVATLLGIKIEPMDPALLVSHIWNHVQECLTTSTSPSFPTELSNFLSDLTSLSQTIIDLAQQLSNLTLRVSLTQGRQASLVACALLMVSLAGVAGKPVPKPRVLASVLGERFGGAARSISDRVREIERLIEDWRHELPWADADLPVNARKRTIKIASWIKDVINFKDALWFKQIEAVAHAHYSPSVESEFESDEDDTSSRTGSYCTTGSKRSNGTQSTSGSKRPCLDRGYHDSGRPRAYVVEHSRRRPSPQTTILASLLNPFSFSPTSTLLALDFAQEISQNKNNIADEDLFEEGELEGFIRSENDVNALRARWEEEGRFEGVPECTDEPQEVPSETVSMRSILDSFDPDVEEVIGSWRDASPMGFNDNVSYFYDD